jgi:hypothetical protein
MKIETKFDVNNLVVSKYQRNTLTKEAGVETVMCFEIIDITTGTCMAGTQVFYDVRAIHGIATTKYNSGEKSIAFHDFVVGYSSKGEYIRLREDEIVLASQEIIDLVTNKSLLKD